MKNRLMFVFALILALTAVCASCASTESVESESGIASSSEVLDDLSTQVEESLDTSVAEDESLIEESTDECIHGENTAFTVSSDKSGYTIFPDTKTGYYLTEFAAETGDGSISITLADGRVLDYEYAEVSFDESESTHLTKINGLDFVITESTDESNNRMQTFTCVEKVDFFSESLDNMITVTYYPETEKGSIQIWFTFESDGEEYTFHYADGHSTEKFIGFDEETETHYFYESEQ